MISHQLRLGCNIHRGKMRNLQRLRLDPSKWFQVLQKEVILRELVGELNVVVATPLGDPGDGLYK